MRISETIAAIATPMGQGGIGIIRISGPDSLKCAQKVFRPAGNTGVEIKERYFYYGTIAESGGAVIDNGFMVFMKSPRSYTGMDVVELQCHGGPLILKKALEALLKTGARIAEPGEFTKQAFLEGKLDLTQAEAVIDLIKAQTDSALLSARGRLEGFFSKRVNEIKEMILMLVAGVEAELDFPEDEIDETGEEEFLSSLEPPQKAIEKLISTFEEGRALKDGVRVLILGKPNVGKSSLLNILLDEERAIVTPVPGTTRDVIEDVVSIKGIPIRLIDTAGIRDTEDEVEAIGVMAAKKRIQGAEIILLIVDASNFGLEDIEVLNSTADKKVILVVNKKDLVDGYDEVKRFFGSLCRTDLMSFISALNGEGIEELKETIYKEVTGHGFGSGDTAPGELMASVRHKDSLSKALHGLSLARQAALDRKPKEFIASDLRWSLDRIGEITGETTTEDILDRVFSEFCIGK